MNDRQGENQTTSLPLTPELRAWLGQTTGDAARQEKLEALAVLAAEAWIGGRNFRPIGRR
jgi:hypothetical protein